MFHRSFNRTISLGAFVLGILGLCGVGPGLDRRFRGPFPRAAKRMERAGPQRPDREPNGSLVGYLANRQIHDAGVDFSNSYSQTYGSWAGWAISNMTYNPANYRPGDYDPGGGANAIRIRCRRAGPANITPCRAELRQTSRGQPIMPLVTSAEKPLRPPTLERPHICRPSPSPRRPH